MTKKDYELIAGVIRESRAEDTTQLYMATLFANALEDTNPLFDRSRFLAACAGRDSTDMAGRKVRYSSR